MDHQIKAALANRPRVTTSAARSANPCPKSRKRRASDQGRAHRIAMVSRRLCSLGRSVATAKVTASADQAPGSHHAWRNRSGKRGLVMAEIVRRARHWRPSNFTRAGPTCIVCRAPSTGGSEASKGDYAGRWRQKKARRAAGLKLGASGRTRRRNNETVAGRERGPAELRRRAWTSFQACGCLREAALALRGAQEVQPGHSTPWGRPCATNQHLSVESVRFSGHKLSVAAVRSPRKRLGPGGEVQDLRPRFFKE